MGIDITQFHQIFFEESFEGLEAMESALLDLSRGSGNSELIHEIFRAAHSIKGGSGTFGFSAVSEFTHVMETLLDEMREGQREINESALNLLLESVDVVRGMLEAARDGGVLEADRVAATQSRLEAMLNGNDIVVQAPSSMTGQQDIHNGWQIDFKPYPELMKTGNDPVRMFHELAEMGELKVVVDTSSIPPAAHFDPEECYLSWKLSLMGDVTEEQINEIFEWVDGDCDLTINPITVENSDMIAAAQVETGTRESSAGMQAESQPATDRQADEAEPNPGERRAVTESSIRVNITKIDELINMVGELVITQSMLGQVGSELENVDSSKLEKLLNGLVQLERNTRELQESVMRIRMFPISFSFNRFPRMVHDLSSQLGKKVELKISGESTELDKTVMEKISDPLVHLVRNSLDHGIETPEVRVAKGKPETGIVHLNAYHRGGNIIIEVSDDGGGLPTDRILAKARQRALVADDEPLTREKTLDLIFEPGFTTAEELSDVSGRGVGMDVVRRNIRDLGGSIEVTSEQDKGSKFTVRLPLTLAILDGQLLSVGSETFIMPLVSIVESLQLDCNLINKVAGQAEMYRLRDDYVPVVRLCKLFGIKPKSMNLQDGLLVVVEQDGMRIGLLVDELLGQQQVVIKSLETNFRRVEGLSGATILGDGTVALILDVGGLIAMSSRGPVSGPPHKKDQAA